MCDTQMEPKEVVKMIVTEYVNPVMRLPDTDEAFQKWWEIMKDMERKDKSPLYQGILLALVNEGVVPGRNLGNKVQRKLLDFQDIKQIMNVCYSSIFRSGESSIPALRSKFQNIPFAQNLLDAYQTLYKPEMTA